VLQNATLYQVLTVLVVRTYTNSYTNLNCLKESLFISFAKLISLTSEYFVSSIRLFPSPVQLKS